MAFRDQQAKLLHRASEALRQHGQQTNRHGVVDEVKEEGGERCFRCTIGVKPDGTPWRTPWMRSQEQRSGGERSQSKVKEGQNMVIQGDPRNGTATPSSEADHAPQPNHAPQTNGFSQSVGKRLRIAHHGGKDEGGQGGGGQGGGGGGQQQGDEFHYSGNWISEEDEEMKQWKPQSGKAEGGGSSGSQLGSGGGIEKGQQQEQQKQGEQKKEKRAMQTFMHQKNGAAGLVGTGDKASRYAAHEKGAKVRSGEDNYFVAEKDKNSFAYAKKDFYAKAKDGQCFVNKPWVIRDGPKDPVPNTELA